MSEANKANADANAPTNERQPADQAAAVQVRAASTDGEQVSCCGACLNFCCYMITTCILAVIFITAAKDQTFLGKWKGTQAPDYGSKEMLLKY